MLSWADSLGNVDCWKGQTTRLAATPGQRPVVPPSSSSEPLQVNTTEGHNNVELIAYLGSACC